MVLAMKDIKVINQTITTYIYTNTFKDRPEMTWVAELDEHPACYLHDEDGIAKWRITKKNLCI